MLKMFLDEFTFIDLFYLKNKLCKNTFVFLKLHILPMWYTFKTRNYLVLYFVTLTSHVIYFVRHFS